MLVYAATFDNYYNYDSVFIYLSTLEYLQVMKKNEFGRTVATRGTRCSNLCSGTCNPGSIG